MAENRCSGWRLSAVRLKLWVLAPSMPTLWNASLSILSALACEYVLARVALETNSLYGDLDRIPPSIF
jgi:hypothetical protein